MKSASPPSAVASIASIERRPRDHRRRPSPPPRQRGRRWPSAGVRVTERVRRLMPSSRSISSTCAAIEAGSRVEHLVRGGLGSPTRPRRVSDEVASSDSSMASSPPPPAATRSGITRYPLPALRRRARPRPCVITDHVAAGVDLVHEEQERTSALNSADVIAAAATSSSDGSLTTSMSRSPGWSVTSIAGYRRRGRPGSGSVTECGAEAFWLASARSASGVPIRLQYGCAEGVRMIEARACSPSSASWLQRRTSQRRWPARGAPTSSSCCSCSSSPRPAACTREWALLPNRCTTAAPDPEATA